MNTIELETNAKLLTTRKKALFDLTLEVESDKYIRLKWSAVS